MLYNPNYAALAFAEKEAVYVSKITKRIGIGATITTIISGALMAIFTPHVLLWIGIIIGLDIGATVMSWAYTQVRKMTRYPNKEHWWADEAKVWIMWRAVNSGFVFSLLAGAVFAFFSNPLEGKQVAAAVLLWLLNCVLVGLSSPFTWVWTFKHLIPLLNRRVDSIGVRIDRDEAGKVVGIKDGDDDTMFVKGGHHEIPEKCGKVDTGVPDSGGPVPVVPAPDTGGEGAT